MQNKWITRVLLMLGLMAFATALFASNDDETENMILLYLKAFEKGFGRPNQAQSESIAQIIMSFMIYGDRDLNKLSYILSTAWHESKLQLVKEKRGTPGSDLHKLQEKYWDSGFYGRGFVQLTHRDNYAKLGKLLNIDLVNNPDLALDRRYAADIIVLGMMQGLFTGVSLRNYISPSHQDYVSARKVVNGLDRAQLIADYTTKLNNSLEYQIV
jgi:putative chitinase